MPSTPIDPPSLNGASFSPKRKDMSQPSSKTQKQKKPEDDVALSLLKEEQAKLAALKEEELVQHEIASKIMELYNQSMRRHSALTERERVLSKHAGQLLNGLQREEAIAAKVSNTIRRVRHVRKQLLARITTPRWEVPHHYHMTCCEHILGHSQPHVMEVGEMLPGHLRLFSFAKRNILFTKSLIFALARAKQERKNASEKIKEAYKDLRSTRAQIKENDKLLIEIRKKSHLLPHAAKKKSPPGSPLSSLTFNYRTDHINNNKTLPASSTTTATTPPTSISPTNSSLEKRSNGLLKPNGTTERTPERKDLYRRRHSDQALVALSRAQSVKARYYTSLNLPLDKIEEQLEDVIKKEKDGVGVEEKEWKQMKKLLDDLEKNTTKKNNTQADLVFIQNRRSRYGLPPPSSQASPPPGLTTSSSTPMLPSEVKKQPSPELQAKKEPSTTMEKLETTTTKPLSSEEQNELDRILASKPPSTTVGGGKATTTTTTEMGSVSRILEQKRYLALTSNSPTQLSSHATSTSTSKNNNSKGKKKTSGAKNISGSSASSSPSSSSFSSFFAPSSPSPTSPSSFLSVSASPPTPIINKKNNKSTSSLSSSSSSSLSDPDELEENDDDEQVNGGLVRPLPFKPGSPL